MGVSTNAKIMPELPRFTICLYLVTSVSRQIQVFVAIFQQRYYKITGYAS